MNEDRKHGFGDRDVPGKCRHGRPDNACRYCEGDTVRSHTGTGKPPSDGWQAYDGPLYCPDCGTDHRDDDPCPKLRRGRVLSGGRVVGSAEGGFPRVTEEQAASVREAVARVTEERFEACGEHSTSLDSHLTCDKTKGHDGYHRHTFPRHGLAASEHLWAPREDGLPPCQWKCDTCEPTCPEYDHEAARTEGRLSEQERAVP